MSKLKEFLSGETVFLESDLQEIRNIVLEEEGFKWIPVTERLPEINEYVLITMKDFFNHYTTIGVLIKDSIGDLKWIVDDIAVSSIDIIAWMPRPKPY